MIFSINDIKEITSSISVYRDMDYTNYVLSFLKRRFSKIYDLFNIKRHAQFYELLKDDTLRDKVIGEMFIASGEMFRDPSFWQFIRDEVLKNLSKIGTTVWMPNETGNGAYSLAIIIHEQRLNNELTILCNNPSGYRCRNIINGIFDSEQYDNNLDNYNRLERNNLFEFYFSKENNIQFISHEMRQIVKCKQVSYDKAVENEKIAMIISRNQSLYYNHNLSEQYFETLFQKLKPGGFLAIGIKEHLPESVANKMIVVNETEKVYKKSLTVE